MEGEHAGLIIALLIIFIDDNAVLYCDHGIDIGTLQICMQLGENRWIHLTVFRQIDLPGSDDGDILLGDCGRICSTLLHAFKRRRSALGKTFQPGRVYSGEPEQAVKAIMIVNKRRNIFS